MLWAVLRSEDVCADFHWISLWVQPEIRKTACEGWGKGKADNYIYSVSVEVRIIPNPPKNIFPMRNSNHCSEIKVGGFVEGHLRSMGKKKSSQPS